MGSKFWGTGFEKEQIGHIQVPPLTGGGLKGFALTWAAKGGRPWDAPDDCTCLNGCFSCLGKSTTLGEDFRKPA